MTSLTSLQVVAIAMTNLSTRDVLLLLLLLVLVMIVIIT